MKSHSKQFINRAISAMLGAIELYNKPGFPYKMEAFSILAINGWELLLKAKWLHENKGKTSCLYVFEPRTKKDGTKSKKEKIKTSDSGVPFTRSISWLAARLYEQKKMDASVLNNLNCLNEIRNACVHFHCISKELNHRLYGYGAACVIQKKQSNKHLLRRRRET